MPVIARARPSLPQVGRERTAKLQKPAAGRLIGYINTALRQLLPNVAKKEREPGVKPNGVSDNIGRKSVAFIWDRRHVTI